MQKWEYLYIYRSRGWAAPEKGHNYHEASKWSTRIYTGGTGKDTNETLSDVLTRLGEEGWEMVAGWPRSSILGGYTVVMAASDYAGFTDEEVILFKRPKE